MITDHPPFGQLSDLAGGDVAPDVSAALERHLAVCVACREEVARLRAVLERVAALPRAVEPPAEAWIVLRRTLRRQAAPASAPTHWSRRWGLQAAAALLLVAGSSALTVLALRDRAPGPVATVPYGSAASRPAAPVAQVVERSYAEVVDELTATLRAQRGALAPAKLTTLERTLRVIDEAIAEARAALAADPNNDALIDVLSANYEQKVQLLRRAAELPART